MKQYEKWLNEHFRLVCLSQQSKDKMCRTWRAALEWVLEHEYSYINNKPGVYDVIRQELKTNKTVVVNRHYKSFTKYIGRGTEFGNDYKIGPDGTREDVIAKHKKDFYNNPELQEAVWNELRGK